MYDILYSITAHEAPDCVIDLVENIFANHVGLQVGIFLHTNPTLYSALENTIPYKHVWLHPEPFEKAWSSYGIFLGHIMNMTYMMQHSIKGRYVCILASNCMFHRLVTPELLDAKYNEPDETYVPTGHMPPIPEWGPSYQLQCNHVFFRFFHEFKIPFVNSYHEGILFYWDTISQIVSFRDWVAMRPLVALEFSFEEVLFSSLHVFFTGRKVRSICTLKDIQHDSIHEIQNPCIKPVPRKYNNPVRVWLRNQRQVISLDHVKK